jgi:RNA polymerase sigma-70 factor (ECF subfamily)
MANTYALRGPPQPAPGSDLANPWHFEQFFLAYNHVVHRVCLRLLKDGAAAEDACQETFLAAWRNRHGLRPNRAWLLKVATNKCLDELRRRARHRGQPVDGDGDDEAAYLQSSEPSPEAVVLNLHAAEVLEAALSQLPWLQRTAVVLSDVEGWNYRAIAAACEISEGTVKSRVFRARRSLRQILDQAQLFD